MPRRISFLFSAFVLALLLFAPSASADDESRLTRDDVSVIKKKLVAVLAAIGEPGDGYVKDDESFDLPASFYKDKKTGKISPTHSSAGRRFGSGAEKKAKKDQRDFEGEFERKLAEAQAKGDYQAMAALAQEMQMKAGQANLESVKAKKEPVEIHLSLNDYANQTIDPDAVVFERPGVIALRLKENANDADKATIVAYFDPVSLKETKTLSAIEFKPPDHVDAKTTVINATVRLTGPSTVVEAWAKKMDTKAVLSLIDRTR
ncbi:MAG: hypothetical protein HY886_03465 [Deltaproteobacteria bacterium]|nr:hypothetical protein [Deltaproteobacteria bacterium]